MADESSRELAQLSAAFADHLRLAARRGVRWVAAGPTPRSGEAVALAELPELTVEPELTGVRPSLDEVREALGECQRCRLHRDRRHLVFGVGNPHADLMFIGEAPGLDEDRQGEPFVGKAGQLLTRMIAAMGLRRDEVYIANIVKCRPPKNRDPEPDEVASCEPFLHRQIDAIGPRLIVALGNFAAKTLLRTTTGITRLRGEFRSYQGVPLMPTFHPAYLLRNPDGKKLVWKDLQAVMAEMDRLGLQRQR